MINFYYKGEKAPSKVYDVASGCLLIIAFSAIIYFFTLIDDIEDLEEYWLQLVFILLMGGSVFFQMFRKKGKLHTYRIEIKNNCLKMNDVEVKIESLTLDIYKKNQEFIRYHLRDRHGKLAIYSVFEDDLSKYLQEHLTNQTNFLEEISCKYDGSDVTLISDKQSLHYDLESGKYTIDLGKQTSISFTPDVFAYDGKYEKGVGLIKKK